MAEAEERRRRRADVYIPIYLISDSVAEPKEGRFLQKHRFLIIRAAATIAVLPKCFIG